MQEWIDKINALKWQEITDYIKQVVAPQVIAQLAAFLLILFLSRLIKRLVVRLMTFSESTLEEMPWLNVFRTVLIETIYPFIAYGLLKVFIRIYAFFELKTEVLLWISSLLLIGFIYGVLSAIIQLNMKEVQARFWGRQVLFPATITVVVLSGLGLLDDVMGWGLAIPNVDVKITIGSLLLGVALLFGFYFLGRGIRYFLSQHFLPKSGIEPALIQGISTLISYFIVFIGTLFGLGAIGIDLTTLTVVAGGLSVGLGFGLQAIVSNFISGFILLFEKSVGPGDVIKIGDVTGTVQQVGVRSITILTRDHIELIVPNSHYLTEVVTNLTRTSRNIRIAILVGVSYDADPHMAKEALLAAAEGTDYVMKLPAYEVQFMDFGESSLDFRLLIWTNRPELSMVISSNLRFNIWNELKKRHIEIPYPQRDIHIRSGQDKI